MAADENTSGRSFAWLNSTQFFGALNDNVFKLLIIMFVGGLSETGSASEVASKVGAIFVLPFILCAAHSGVLADRVSKRNVIVGCKLAEILLMFAGLGCFLAGSVPGLYVVLLLMATQSTFFAPAKYGVIPELVPAHRISKANSVITMFTYIAIVIGTFLPALALELTDGSYRVAGMLCISLAALGALSSAAIHRTPPAGSTQGSTWMFLRQIRATLHDLRPDKQLLLTVWATAFFLFCAAFIQMNLFPYGEQRLFAHLDPDMRYIKSCYLFTFVAVGIGVGGILVGRLSGRNIEFGLVPIGVLGMTTSCLVLALAPPRLDLVRAVLFVLGTSAAFYIIPLQAFIQFRAPRDRLGKILAASSFLSFSGALLAAGALALVSKLGLSAGQGFAVIGVLMIALSLYAFRILPDFVVRLAVVLFTRFCYRIRTHGI